MSVSTLILATLFSIAFSLWVRRTTWNQTYERAATLNLVLQGCAVILMSPWASEHIGKPIHSVLGIYNLEDYLGHDLYIVAASAIVLNALGRLDEGSYLTRSFKLFVELPATICIPLMLCVFSLSHAADTYVVDFFQMPVDLWLLAYWVILCVILIHLLTYGSKLLMILRDDPRSLQVADAYIASCVCGIIACGARITVSIVPVSPVVGSAIVWFFACACGVGFAATAAYSYLNKEKVERSETAPDPAPKPETV
ncbi:membrane protein [Mycobacterium phage Aegeus]|nr:membrane protein [Mycobacterium phage Baudelaire]WKW86534.1 membrane protein [Mycobacterium phage Aegeus]